MVCGCRTWRPAAGTPGALIAAHPDHVRVELTQGDPLVLYAPELQGDSIIAYRQKGVDSSRTAVPLSDVRTVEVERVDVPWTLGVMVAAAGGLFVFKLIVDEIGPLFRCDPNSYVRVGC